MNNLKCRKQGFNKFVCKKTNKEIKMSDCKNCPYKEYKTNSSNSIKLKTKTSKQSKLERERKSLFTDDLQHCIICGRKREHIHEVFYGRNRKNSMIYKLCIPVCCDCHRKMHSDTNLQEKYHKKGQALFNETYPDLDFQDIFKINYL